MKLTALFCTVAMLVIGIFDAVMVTTHGVDASVSRFLQNTAFDSPAFAFMMGFVAGHVFGYMQPTAKRIYDKPTSSNRSIEMAEAVGSPLSDEIKIELAALIAAYKAATADGSVSLSEAMSIATRGITGVVSIVHRLQAGSDRATRRAMILTGVGEFYDQVIAPIDLKAVPNFIEGIVDRAGKEMLLIGAGSLVDLLLDLLDRPAVPQPTPDDGDQDAAKPHSNVIGQAGPLAVSLVGFERPA